MGLPNSEKELISIGASVAVGCEMCVDVHVRDAHRFGVKDESIERVLAIALDLRDEATRLIRRRGLRALGMRVLGRDTDEDPSPPLASQASRSDQLVSVAAAFALNCDPALERHVALARDLGVTEDELKRTVGLAKFVRGKAESLCCKWI